MFRSTVAKSAGMMCRFAATRGMASMPALRVAAARATVSRQMPVAAAMAQRASAIRFYSAGPEPLTKEFVFERIEALLKNFDKVRLT